MRKLFPYITRPILVLSLVSLFTDMASEMLYPVMPAFLESIGFSILLIGLLEGLAEMIAGLSKGYFGKRSDIQQKRLPFVQLGYALSAISKPMMALLSYPLWIFFARTTDRVGKGLRSAPRDAMLNANASKETKASVFGFHRSMDTIGAIVGPLLALIYLQCYPQDYKNLFLLAFIPGLIAVIFTWSLKEEKKAARGERVKFFSFLSYLPNAKKPYRQLVIGLLAFALVNSSDVLLLLRMKQIGIDDVTIISMYIGYNIIYALLAFPIGILADKVSIKYIFIAGLLIFAVVYTGFAYAESATTYYILFACYGIYAAATEGIAKAWITNITPKEEAGTAIGTYTGLSSIAAFFASALAGLIWSVAGAGWAFGISAAVALLVGAYLVSIPFQRVVSSANGA
ncbi:MAG TPA: MFS transporter [Chitinophagales bacterium]|nr:MFS transporter [Chitinophagales bacterium]HMZ89808.1 MFS transporter [Chitinophagales bacterium]HNK97601.1 MFS transporter [Chitinophagales bacterium]HNM08472.1 MFS transporter [Chitinophagales bacterium]HNM30074.1 MFS transporter [Chitinophagales bacterium]